MVTVTLIGADGSGKSTLGHNLQKYLNHPTAYIYMGDNPISATHMLPSTRLWVEYKRRSDNRIYGGPPDPAKHAPRSKNILKRLIRELKSAAHITILISEEWYRQAIIWIYHIRGLIVITDRHYYLDYYYHHIHSNGRFLTIAARIHGFTLNKLYPKPSLVLFLDAPPKILFTRKSEGTLKLLKTRRQEYLNLAKFVPHFYTIDATQSIETVTQQAIDLILTHAKSKSK